MKITTVLCMPELEPSLEFWTKRLGFDVTVSVPEEDKLGFAILQKGSAEIMLQTHSSAAKDVPSLGEYCRNAKAALFIEVEDFDDILQRIGGLPLALPVRTAVYGMKEVGLYEPGGNLIIFACPVK